MSIYDIKITERNGEELSLEKYKGKIMAVVCYVGDSRTMTIENLEEVYNLHSKDVPKAEELYKDKYFKFTGTISHKYKTYTQIQSDYVSVLC